MRSGFTAAESMVVCATGYSLTSFALTLHSCVWLTVRGHQRFRIKALFQVCTVKRIRFLLSDR